MSDLPGIEPEVVEELLQHLDDDETDLITTLGIGLIYEIAPPGTRFFSMDYYERGLRLWRAFKSELYGFICDAEQRKPKFWVTELIGGDIRNLATGLILAIHTNYNVAESCPVKKRASL
jgi:hypothetical protein